MTPGDMERGRAIYENGKQPETEEAHRREAQELVAALEPTERRALRRIIEGHSLITMAAELGASLEGAVRLKASLMTKLGATMTADLVRVGIYAQVDEGR